MYAFVKKCIGWFLVRIEAFFPNGLFWLASNFLNRWSSLLLCTVYHHAAHVVLPVLLLAALLFRLVRLVAADWARRHSWLLTLVLCHCWLSVDAGTMQAEIVFLRKVVRVRLKGGLGDFGALPGIALLLAIR